MRTEPGKAVRPLDLIPVLGGSFGVDSLKLAIQLALAAENPIAAAKRVAYGEPIELVLGSVEFAGLSFTCRRGVFTPRKSTIEVIERAAQLLIERDQPKPRVLDIGTGIGVIAIVLAKLVGNGTFVGIDINRQAVKVARVNATKLVSDLDVTFTVADVLEQDVILPNNLDLLVCNPPYIPTHVKLPAIVADYQPHKALYSGLDGMEMTRSCLLHAENLVAPGGLVLIEHDPAQSGIVRSLAQNMTNLDIVSQTQPRPYTTFRRQGSM